METVQFGEKVDQYTERKLFQKIAEVLNIECGSDFIGSHPVSLCRENMQNLLDTDYLVCEKSDGIRAMLFAYNKILYFYDRKNVFYKTRYALSMDDIYLLDGEIYKEEDGFIFAIFDTLISKNISQTKQNLVVRLDKAYAFTRSLEKSHGILQIQNDSAYFKFKIITKQMTKSYGFYQILDTIPKLCHENDGLIFTPVEDKYMVSARSRTLKWKPSHLNTVDFSIKKSVYPQTYDLFGVVMDNQLPKGRFTGAVHQKEDGSSLRKFATFYSPENADDIDGKIGEFRFDPEKDVLDFNDYSIIKGGWSLYKIRTDKNTPNNIKVIFGVLESIKENISEPVLRSYWKIMAERYKKRHSGIFN